MLDYFIKRKVISQIVLACRVRAGEGGAVHKNRASHGLMLNCKGKKTYTFSDGTVCSVKENEILYIPKYSNYVVTASEPGDVYCINFQCFEDAPYKPFTQPITNVDEVIKAYQSAEKAWQRVMDGREYRVMASLYKILYEMYRAQNAPYLPKTKQELLKPAIEHIHKFYTKELISVEYLSSLCGISANYLRRLFEKFYGVSPIKYINNLKIKRATELLTSGLYSVSETAFNSGFSDVSHFSRFFKENVGVLPSEYFEQE